MRWFWIDRFIEFTSGHRAVALKTVALSEPQIDNYQPGYPVHPCSLIIEGLAQTGGLLVAEHNNFQERVVLAKVSKAKFHRPARPGDTLRYTAIVEDVREDGAIIGGTSHIGDDLQAEVDIVFAHLDDRFEGDNLFEPPEFLRLMRLLRLYEVGRNADGTVLQPPPHLFAAEAEDLARPWS
jgi:3-hydroxyacyl-[acyl-carrier-protein] dehydratase